MLDSESSLRLKLLRFPPIVGVIYIHAYNTAIGYAGGVLGVTEVNELTRWVRVFLSEGIARISVPLFFLMSGYLFFATFHWSQQTYWRKIVSRLRSLFIPFVFWNLAGLGFLALMQAIPDFRPYFVGAGKLVADYDLPQLLSVLFGVNGYPVAYHFWFIRDLMLLVLMAPVLAVIVRFLPIPFFLAVYVCWVSESWPIYAPGAVGVLFFSAGALCGINRQNIFAFDRFGLAIVLVYLPLLVADVIWYDAWFNNYVHRTGLIAGVLVTLYLTKFAVRSRGLCNALLALGGASFFVYAAHEPLLGILRLLAYKYIPLDNPYTVLLLYLGIPILVMALLVGCHRVLNAVCPRTLGIITGGR
ncbi:acyltransferase [Desulfobulbus sp.]|uniref:acyltransferase n=1 Tax=Desulfobulbus sp. TaxID=895 RepID=UPI00286F0375|nr:acyltransferase [Desulfobulbus sp.]